MRAWYLATFVYKRGTAAWKNLPAAEQKELTKLLRKAGARPDLNLRPRERKRLKELVRLLAKGGER